MPLILTEKSRSFGRLHLWSLTEEKAELLQLLGGANLETAHIHDWHPQRQVEWLAGRNLIAQCLEPNLDKLKTLESGKLALTSSDVHFSLSHSEQLVGLQHHDVPVGVDIQIKTPTIQKVAPKFCSPEDYASLLPYYSKAVANHICWSMKEAVYKAYGEGKVNYKEQISFTAFANEDAKRPILQLKKKDGPLLQYYGKLRWLGPFLVAQVVLDTSADV